MSKQYYAIQLEDYTLPSYLPFPKTYYGTLEQIDALIRCLDANPATAIRFASTICAFEHFKKGQLDAMHTISCQAVQLLTPVQFIHETMIVEENAQWYFTTGSISILFARNVCICIRSFCGMGICICVVCVPAMQRSGMTIPMKGGPVCRLVITVSPICMLWKTGGIPCGSIRWSK